MARAPRTQETEPVPEADALDGFPHPRLAERLFGHTAAEAMLAEAACSERLHHGWLMTGASGIGKATLAYRFAKFLLSRANDRTQAPGSLDCDPAGRGARQVVSLSHPGLLVIRRPYNFKDKRFKASITIDEVRRLRDFLGHKSADGSWRVVIVDPVEDMNANAANALLKSLEEPPARCVFLLVTSEPGRLLPTIRSRCRRLQLSSLTDTELDEAARASIAASDGTEAPGEQDWQRLRSLSGGSVRRFLSLASTDGIKISQRLDAIFSSLGGRMDWTGIHALAEEL
ncbi:MAG TPA: DNA polymerase III subunit delta', partial [Hyphomicrobiaceae bacterium]|nr:DNA polymerase III subunit delta' [Hyphomicrobiaceae bacterium]